MPRRHTTTASNTEHSTEYPKRNLTCTTLNTVINVGAVLPTTPCMHEYSLPCRSRAHRWPLTSHNPHTRGPQLRLVVAFQRWRLRQLRPCPHRRQQHSQLPLQVVHPLQLLLPQLLQLGSGAAAAPVASLDEGGPSAKRGPPAGAGCWVPGRAGSTCTQGCSCRGAFARSQPRAARCARGRCCHVSGSMLRTPCLCLHAALANLPQVRPAAAAPWLPSLPDMRTRPAPTLVLENLLLRAGTTVFFPHSSSPTSSRLSTSPPPKMTQMPHSCAGRKEGRGQMGREGQELRAGHWHNVAAAFQNNSALCAEQPRTPAAEQNTTRALR